MTTIIAGMTPDEYIIALQDNFTDSNSAINTTLQGGELETEINNSFAVFKSVYSPSMPLGSVNVGMSAASLVSTLNSNFNSLCALLPVPITGTLLAEKAIHCWLRDTNVIYDTSVNKSFACEQYFDGTGYIPTVIEINHATGIVTKTVVGTEYFYDDHIECVILQRSSDKRLIVVYRHDGNHACYYKLSTNPSDSTAWGNETVLIRDLGGLVIYIYYNIYQVTNRDIYFFYATSDSAGVQRRYYKKSVDDGVNWSAGVLYGEPVGCILYHQLGYQSKIDENIIHFIVSPDAGETGQSSSIYPNIQSHFYFDASTDTFHKSDGTNVTANIPLSFDGWTPLLTNAIPTHGWIEDITLDSNGYPRVLLTHYIDIVQYPEKKDLYYMEWNGDSWSTPHKIYQSMNKNIGVDIGMATYPPCAVFDKTSPDIIYGCKEIVNQGKLEVYKVTRLAGNSFVRVKLTETDNDCWRVFTNNSPNMNVMWLDKISYNASNGPFNQNLMGGIF